ncbi:hypothetical protein OS493_027272 [Desmophyllum pertusum]|uniref:Uncharacterized protein n=1 Tax=Desmophyllum pertusum TaxID=174260 RepID=A0A9W9ZAE7_9CNID|nr:hypothetical protein OS493_027272 [Desmophyllum pertusum]
MEVLQHVLQSTQPSGACKIEQKDLSSARPDKEIITSSDMSTQCCVGPRYIITRSASTQAPEAPVVSTPVPVKTFCDIGIQVGPSGIDHTNKRKRDDSDDDTGNHKHKPTVFEEVYPSDEEPSNDPPSSL